MCALHLIHHVSGSKTNIEHNTENVSIKRKRYKDQRIYALHVDAMECMKYGRDSTLHAAPITE